MCITFTPDSAMEDGFDHMLIYDGPCGEVSSTPPIDFTGPISEWPGVVDDTLYLHPLAADGTVCICYTSDEAVELVGYQVTAVTYE